MTTTQLDARRAAGLAGLAQAATASRASESSFREIIDKLPAAVYTTDAEGRLTHFNRACVDFSGRTPELGSDHWCVSWKLYYPDGRPMPHDACPMAVALNEGREMRGQQAIAERPDGTRIWFEPYPVPLRDERGAIVGGVNMLVDITEIKRAEAALRKSERELADFFESAVVGLHFVGPDGTILRANQAELDLLGYSRDEYVGRKITEFHSDENAIDEILRKLQAGETLARYEARLRCKDGSIKHVLIDSNVLWEEGCFVHTRCFTRDITEQKRAEAERTELLAREREARREAEALNEVARAVAGLDLQAVVQKATDAATELTGARFGAFFYNVIDEHGEAFLLYTLSGAPREAFEKLGLPRNTAVFGPTFRGEGVVRIADVLSDPRYGKNSPNKGMPPGHLQVRSYLAVPVVASSGEVLGGLFFGHPEAGVFTDQSERVAAGIAVHAAIAMDNARLFENAQQEIAERKKIEDQLRHNTEELARFNQVAVGRELRMIELKKEINELRERLGEAPRYPLQFDQEAGASNG